MSVGSRRNADAEVLPGKRKQLGRRAAHTRERNTSAAKCKAAPKIGFVTHFAGPRGWLCKVVGDGALPARLLS